LTFGRLTFEQFELVELVELVELCELFKLFAASLALVLSRRSLGRAHKSAARAELEARATHTPRKEAPTGPMSQTGSTGPLRNAQTRAAQQAAQQAHSSCTTGNSAWPSADCLPPGQEEASPKLLELLKHKPHKPHEQAKVARVAPPPSSPPRLPNGHSSGAKKAASSSKLAKKQPKRRTFSLSCRTLAQLEPQRRETATSGGRFGQLSLGK